MHKYQGVGVLVGQDALKKEAVDHANVICNVKQDLVKTAEQESAGILASPFFKKSMSLKQ